MSITAIAGSSSQLAGLQGQYQQIRSQFKQLGQDLQGGSLTKAQTDFVTLSQSVASRFSGTNPVAQTLSQIGQALQSGNLSAAQQAFSPISSVEPYVRAHHSHVPPMADKLSQSIDQLGQALQSGNLTTAQQAFAAVQQLWQQMPGSSLTPNDTAVATSTTSVSA
jgi:soluble cytochrome b562